LTGSPLPVNPVGMNVRDSTLTAREAAWEFSAVLQQ
jgi:hypothetical protein